MKVSLSVDGRPFGPGGFDLVGVRARGGDVVLRGIGANDAGETSDLTIELTGDEYKRIALAVEELRAFHGHGLPVDDAGRIVGESDSQLAARRRQS